MELKDLKDFYEKQEYYDYDETKTTSENRLKEITFFVNITSFSVILSVMTYIFISFTNSLFAVPLALIVGLVVFFVFKKIFKRIIHSIMK
jgi:hypothetical protein